MALLTQASTCRSNTACHPELNEKNSAQKRSFSNVCKSELIPSRRSCLRPELRGQVPVPEREQEPVRVPVRVQAQVREREPVRVPGQEQAQVQERGPVPEQVRVRVPVRVQEQEPVRARVLQPVHYKY